MSLPIDTRTDAPDTQRITRGGRRKRNEYALVAWYSITLSSSAWDANIMSIACCASLGKSNVTANGPVSAVQSVVWIVPTRVVARYPV